MEALEAGCAWEDWAYNLKRMVETLAIRLGEGDRCWQQQPLAMVTGLTDHIWTFKELQMTVVPPSALNM